MSIIYQHRRSDTGKIFYIGCGSSISRAKSIGGKTADWLNIVHKTDYTIEILYENIEYKFARWIEIKLIKKYKKTLVNKNIGLEETWGHYDSKIINIKPTLILKFKKRIRKKVVNRANRLPFHTT